MKIAALSDIHANWVAYRAVADHIQTWKPDLVIVAGDIINRGPRPAECLEFTHEQMQTHGWIVIKGNHEDYVIQQANSPLARPDPSADVHRASYWTGQKLGEKLTSLQNMPDEISLQVSNGDEIRIRHASMRGNRDGIYPETRLNTLRKQIAPPPPLFIVGHTHRPLIRRIDTTLVINVGSAGLPFDCDPRPCYAQITHSNGSWEASLKRVPYNHSAAVQDFYSTGYLDGAGPLATIVLHELQESKSHLYNWASRYQQAILKGEICMQESVDRYIREDAHQPAHWDISAID